MQSHMQFCKFCSLWYLCNTCNTPQPSRVVCTVKRHQLRQQLRSAWAAHAWLTHVAYNRCCRCYTWPFAAILGSRRGFLTMLHTMAWSKSVHSYVCARLQCCDGRPAAHTLTHRQACLAVCQSVGGAQAISDAA